MNTGNITSLFTNALTLLKRKHFANAATAFKNILVAEPNNYNALFYLALALYENGQFRQSLSCWNRLKKRGPNLQNVNLNIGCTYHHLGRLDLAIRGYKKELALRPLCGEALYSLGTLYFRRRQFVLAIPYLKTCLAINHYSNRILKRLALSYWKAGRLQDEQQLYEDWILTHPRDSWSLNNLGASLAQNGEVSRAELFFRKASSIAPRDRCILENLRKVELLRSKQNMDAQKRLLQCHRKMFN
jgi:tetratricopeptide (TPR) repeat protein